MKKALVLRWLMYCAGIVVLALGLTFNTKAGLGVSPMLSIIYAPCQIWGWNFGNITFVVYCLFVAAQFAVKAPHYNWPDLFQIPLSLVFSRFLNLFSALIPLAPQTLGQQLITMAFAIVFTGCGAATAVNMRLAPNPGDGIVDAIAVKLGKSMGFIKNCTDATCVVITLILDVVTGNCFVGIGLGTVLAMLFIGRVIALFNRLFAQKMVKLAGLTSPYGIAKK